MATWSIEHIPASGGASTFASLAVWGFASLQMSFVNWGIDQAAITTRGGSIAFEAAQFAYLDKLVVWRNGARFAHVWVTALGLSAEKAESRTYTLSGPSWWLAQYAPEDTSNVTVYTAGAYIALAMSSAVAAGAPVGYDSGLSSALNVGCPDVRSAGTILALVQEAARHVPFSTGWWDCSGETPILHAARRSAATAVSLAIGTDAVETFGLTPMPDVQLKSVRIQFGWTGGASYYFDTAGTDSAQSGPNRMQCSLNYATQAQALEAAGCGVAAKVFADMSALPWRGAVNLHATEEIDITPIRPGSALNLTGGLAEWVTMGALVQSATWSIAPEVNDCCTLGLGAPDHLGVQDYFELRAAVGSAAGSESEADPVDPDKPQPGTLDDLNGGTGGGAPLGSVAVQSRGGVWTLGGYSSYDGSAPTRRWLRADTAYTRTYDCGGGAGQQTDQWSAYGVYDPANFSAGPSGENLALLNGWGVSQYFCSEPSPYAKSASTATATATPGTYTSLGSCCGAQNPYALVSGSATNTLSSEYTEDDAWSRLLSTAEWGDGATTAIRTVPTDGITGIRREMRYRTEHTETVGQQIWIEGQWVSGAWVPGHYKTAQTSATYATLIALTPWQRYRVTVPLESRPVDSAGTATGEYVADGTRQHYILANLDGEGGVDWQVVEPKAGYETRIGTPLVEAA